MSPRRPSILFGSQFLPEGFGDVALIDLTHFAASFAARAGGDMEGALDAGADASAADDASGIPSSCRTTEPAPPFVSPASFVLEETVAQSDVYPVGGDRRHSGPREGDSNAIPGPPDLPSELCLPERRRSRSGRR